MTVCYQMSVNIDGHRPDRADAIKEAAEEQWSFDAWDDRGDSLWSSGFDHLGGGATAADFAEDLAEVVWDANGAYCEVTVGAICMDYPEEYSFDERSYWRCRPRVGRKRTDPRDNRYRTRRGDMRQDTIVGIRRRQAEWTGLMGQSSPRGTALSGWNCTATIRSTAV